MRKPRRSFVISCRICSVILGFIAAVCFWYLLSESAGELFMVHGPASILAHEVAIILIVLASAAIWFFAGSSLNQLLLEKFDPNRKVAPECSMSRT